MLNSVKNECDILNEQYNELEKINNKYKKEINEYHKNLNHNNVNIVEANENVIHFNSLIWEILFEIETSYENKTNLSK